MEKFLEFWSHYNAAIIETLVALILVSAIYLAYRAFFGAKGVDAYEAAGAGSSVGGGALNSAQLEKTLQKILDQQSMRKIHLDSDGGAGATAGSGTAPAEMIQELGFLKKSLEEKEKQIVILQEKSAQAEKAVQAGGGGPSALDIAAAASAAAGLAEKERNDYEGKIKELEARLAEYEIISEDIADLSFFKEENARLTKELEEARGGGGGAPGPTTPAQITPQTVPIEQAVLHEAAPSEQPVALEPTPSLQAEPGVAEETAGAIDDSLMAEFAKAVEGQKSGSLENTPQPKENSDSEFENFNKKS